MNMPGPFELLLIFLVILLLFGAKRLPEIGRSLGDTIREFKKALSGSGLDDENKEKRLRDNPPKDPSSKA
jgi:sec-independent protein translocase protein TatA